ncbi:MAG: thiazole synthase [Fusobacterium sp.]|nr:thiazole synthase [Fusobacterium sp.]
MNDKLVLKGHEFESRLLTGTGKFSDKNLIAPMLEASKSNIITMALRRINFENPKENILNYIPKHITLLPNTSGARNAEEAVKIARIAREAGCGDFIKIEIINDMKYLMPDNEETVKATKILADEGFIVLPYIMPDLITAKKLEEAGAAAVMPLGAPIGSNKGLLTKPLIEMLNDNKRLPIIVDAGIGAPSQAAEAMEMGVDAVLVNTAISTAEDPVMMGKAFAMAVEAGRMAYLAKLAKTSKYANASSPLTDFLFRGDK